jgi:hypothetical protein
VRHPLEAKFNAPAADIMEAISKGFRAQADVKGKLAELYFSRLLDGLAARGVIDSYEWFDKDGQPDFLVKAAAKRLAVEVKDIRSGTSKKFADHLSGIVEIQKTRNGIDAQGNRTRGYRKDHFDLLAACLFNQGGHWDFRFARSANLATRPSDPDILEVYQPVVYAGNAVWSQDLEAIVRAALTKK